MHRIDLLILLVLRENVATDIVNAMTLKEIMEMEDIPPMSSNGLYKRLKLLQKDGYIDNGLKSSRAATFYITGAGIKTLGELE